MYSYDNDEPSASVAQTTGPDSTRTAARKAYEARRDKIFRERQLALMTKFHQYRHGRDYKNPLSLSQFPRYRHKEDVDHEFLVTDDITKEQYRGQRSAPDYRRSLRNLKDSEKRRYSRARINTVSRKLFAFGIRFRRVISCGGMGMAALFEVQNRATGLFNKIVAKIALTEKSNTNLHQEREFLKLLKTSDHILQIKQIDELRSMSGGYPTDQVDGAWPADPSTLPEPTIGQVQEADADPGIMLTEYLPFGSLDHWIAKAAELQEDFSNEACWRMLLCLAKACMSMKYPPGMRSTEADAIDLVHFDLDPTNVLVDGAPMLAHAKTHSEQQANNSESMMSGVQYEESEELFENSDASDASMASGSDGSRAYIPKQKQCTHDRSLHLKVADFGLATVVDDAARASDRDLLTLRSRGKARYFPPEQWTAEWDAVHRNPAHENMDIAGQYSSKTNIYQIGMVMVSMMTRMLPEPYPRVFPVKIRDFGHASHSYLDQTPEDFAQLPLRIVNSPAWVVLQQDCVWRYEVSLRELIIRLTAYEPAERPKPEDLVRIVEQRIDYGFAGTEYQPLSDWQWITSANMPTECQPVKGYTLSTGAVPAENTASSSPAEPVPASPPKNAHVPPATYQAESFGGAPLQNQQRSTPKSGAMEVAQILAAMPLPSYPVPMPRPATPMFRVPTGGNQPANNPAYPGAPNLGRPNPAPIYQPTGYEILAARAVQAAQAAQAGQAGQYGQYGHYGQFVPYAQSHVPYGQFGQPMAPMQPFLQPHPGHQVYQPVYNQNSGQAAANFARQFTQAQAQAAPPGAFIPSTGMLNPAANTFVPTYYRPSDQNNPNQGNDGQGNGQGGQGYQ